MAFVKATIDFKPASTGTGIKCTLRKGKASAATITLSLNSAAAKQANIADKDGIEVLLGEGEDHGMIRLRLAVAGRDAKAVMEDLRKVAA